MLQPIVWAHERTGIDANLLARTGYSTWLDVCCLASLGLDPWIFSGPLITHKSEPDGRLNFRVSYFAHPHGYRTHKLQQLGLTPEHALKVATLLQDLLYLALSIEGTRADWKLWLERVCDQQVFTLHDYQTKIEAEV